MKLFDDRAGRELRRSFDELVSTWHGVESKLMLGCPSYTVEGRLFAVLVTDAVVLTRVPDEHRERMSRAFEVKPFETDTRTVDKCVRVSDDDEQLERLLPYIETSYQTALEQSG
jgi:hypothetical protein